MAVLLSTAWADRGHEVILCPTFSGRGPVNYTVPPGVETLFLADLVPPGAGRIARIRALRRLIRDRRPDVILSFLTHVNVLALIAAAGLSVPVVVSERTHPPALMPPLPRSVCVARRLLYPRADAVVCLTGLSRDWCRTRSGTAPTVVIPNPVVLPLPASDPTVLPADVVPENRRVVLVVGRLNAEKRVEVAIEAFARIAAEMPDTDLVILGEGPGRPALEEAVARSGVAARIHLPGFAGNLADWYRRAVLLVLPSSFEGFPGVLLEAMAHGLPTISFDVAAGPRDITDGGRRGVLLPDEDHVPALAAGMRRLLADDGARAQLSDRALGVRDAYDLDHVMGLWGRLLEHVVTARAA